MTAPPVPVAAAKHAPLLLVILLLVAGIGLYWGWQAFWFLTDDSFIFYRYVSNSVLGYGYTWNLPPHRPVEGYTSFLWVLLLDGTWRLTGSQPPDSANVLSLASAYVTTALTLLMLWRLELRPALQRMRLPLILLALAGVLTNRTFLAWTSSGLETALFNALLTAWVYVVLFVSPTQRWRWLLVTATATLSALTRPDGLLLVVASGTLVVLAAVGGPRPRRPKMDWVLAGLPFLGLAAHFLWRKSYYGEWLPNTFAAKYVSAWPESGWRYALSFVIEYALWFWLGLAVVFVALKLRPTWRRIRAGWSTTRDPQGLPISALSVVVAVGALGAHFAYYTFVIGGDFFEYRVYSHLVGLLFVSSLWLINAVNWGPRRALAYLSLFVACGLPIPWTHWQLSQPLTTREQTQPLILAVAPHLPAFAQPYVGLFDDLQAWLITHGVCVRHQTHKIFVQERLALYPSRDRGLLIAPDPHPTFVAGAVGVISWQYPTVNILDSLGLNDYVIARNPTDPDRPRFMAHDRFAPPGYLECFEPNFKMVADNKYVVAQRIGDMTQRIPDCESRDWPAGASLPLRVDGEHPPENLELAQRAPAVDRYLWTIWPADPTYLYVVPPDQDGTQTAAELNAALNRYAGPGCLVWQPAGAGARPYLFTFLPGQRRPPLSEVQTRFPWANIVDESNLDEPFAYNLAYATPYEAPAVVVPEQRHEAVWSNHLALLGLDLDADSVAPGDTVWLTLYQSVTAPLSDASFSFFVHLLNDANRTGPELIAQDDGEACRGLYPVTAWEADTLIAFRVALLVPETTPPGEYRLVTGLYNWQTGRRLALTQPVGDTDSVTLSTIVVRPR